MAYTTGDRLTIHCSFNAAVDVSEIDGGNTYQTFMQDATVGTNGGTYTVTYAPDNVHKWEGVYIAENAAGLNLDASWKGTPTKTGTVPAADKTVMVFVRYVKAIGDPGTVTVSNNTASETKAILGPGESILAPCDNYDDFYAVVEDYTEDVNEAHLIFIAIGKP